MSRNSTPTFPPNLVRISTSPDTNTKCFPLQRGQKIWPPLLKYWSSIKDWNWFWFICRKASLLQVDGNVDTGGKWCEPQPQIARPEALPVLLGKQPSLNRPWPLPPDSPLTPVQHIHLIRRYITSPAETASLNELYHHHTLTLAAGVVHFKVPKN